jgi:hypothetical protein
VGLPDCRKVQVEGFLPIGIVDGKKARISHVTGMGELHQEPIERALPTGEKDETSQGLAIAMIVEAHLYFQATVFSGVATVHLAGDPGSRDGLLGL